jgi:exopolysaccharide production protein ExoQ
LELVRPPTSAPYQASFGRGEIVGRWGPLLHTVLTAGFLIFVFIGTSPLSTDTLADRVDGNPLNRLVLLTLAGMAVLVLSANYRALPALILGASATWIISALAVLSMFWSDFPDLTLRRAVVLVCMVVISAGVAAGIQDLRKATKVFSLFAACVVLLNFAALAILPGQAMSDIGLQGIYSQKNVAGTVGMIAVLAHATWLFGWRHTPSGALAAAMILCLSMAFLVLTESKTSLALTILGLGLLVLYRLTIKAGPIVILAATLAALAFSAFFVLLLAINEFSLMALLELVLEDTSFTGRDELWAFASRVAMERPWLGHGYAAFWDVGIGADPVHRVDAGTWLGDTEPGIINQAHNGYLELWLQLGLPATLLAGGAFIALFFKSLLKSFSSGDNSQPVFALFSVMALIFILHNITEASLFVRGILLFSVMLPIIFLVARANSFAADMNDRHDAG